MDADTDMSSERVLQGRNLGARVDLTVEEKYRSTDHSGAGWESGADLDCLFQRQGPDWAGWVSARAKFDQTT